LPPAAFAGFLLAIAAVLVIGFLSYRSQEQRSVAAQAVTRTLQIVAEVEQPLSKMKDAETGQRGYLLTGSESYLQPYENARISIEADLARLRMQTADNPNQQQRFAALEKVIAEKMQELARTIAQRRAGDAEGALAVVSSDRGRAAMDRIRGLTEEIENEERMLLSNRQAEWEAAITFSSVVTLGGLALLLVLIASGALMASRDYRAREREIWLRTGQAGLSGHTQGDQRLDTLGRNVLEFLADYLDAQLGALYMAEGSGRFRRVAGYAVNEQALAETTQSGDSLLGQAARENRVLHVRDVPSGYVHVTSSLGKAEPRELLLMPASVDGIVHAVLELGFFRQLHSEEPELLRRVCEPLGMAVRAAKDRTRLEELLEETQRQSEELQAQQEELRVANEELQEHANALRDSQARLENQQAELEESNAQLEAQTTELERQKQELLDAQTALRASARGLERASRYKSEFLANMSHELRTPLNSSLILAKVLADNPAGNLSEEQVNYAKVIESANNDLLALINDILDLSKIEAGHVELYIEDTALADILERMRTTFEPVALEKKLELRIEASPHAPPSLKTDARRLEQVLRNLVSNALKFTEAGSVQLRVARAGEGRVAFSVEDSGIGIPEDERVAIFDAFHQADGTVSRKYGGTGLGLSISRELARLLGGTIDVQSTVGVGSIFTLTISVEADAAAAAPQEVPAVIPEPSHPRTALASIARAQAPAPVIDHIADDRDRRARERLILIVEDDPHFARVLYGLAHELDLDCIHTVSGVEALALAREFKPSGILLDVGLPDESGLSVLERLKRDPATRHIPVHMISVEDHTQPALELGAIGYTLKPAARDQLVEAINALKGRLDERPRRILIVEDDENLRRSIATLLQAQDVEIEALGSVSEALQKLSVSHFDCMVMDIGLPDTSGFELLERVAKSGTYASPPVIVYTGRTLTPQEEQRLRRYSRSIIIKGARSPERLLDEVTLFLHRVEATLPPDQQKLLRQARQRDALFEGRTILLAEDDVRNIYALSSVIEPLGAKLAIARNGREALQRLEGDSVDLVLMDVMMPEMDGLTAMREIRKQSRFAKLPIIAITAKAMPEDRQACLDAGASDYVPKPINVDRLLSLCRVWMPK
jgi:CheY-like chemotaxis protein/CHASE3 domain sensor protein